MSTSRLTRAQFIITRRLETGDQPLVRIHQRRDERAHALRVGALPRDELPRHRREAVLRVGGIHEGAAAVAGAHELLVRVHAGAVDAIEGLGQEGGPRGAWRPAMALTT